MALLQWPSRQGMLVRTQIRSKATVGHNSTGVSAKRKTMMVVSSIASSSASTAFVQSSFTLQVATGRHSSSPTSTCNATPAADLC